MGRLFILQPPAGDLEILDEIGRPSEPNVQNFFGPGMGRNARLSRDLAMDFVGSFVVAKAEEYGVPEPAISGPFGEADLANEDG